MVYLSVFKVSFSISCPINTYIVLKCSVHPYKRSCAYNCSFFDSKFDQVQKDRNLQKNNVIISTSTYCVPNTYKVLRNFLQRFKRSYKKWDWLTDWLTDWRTDWLTDGLTDGSKTLYLSQLVWWGIIRAPVIVLIPQPWCCNFT